MSSNAARPALIVRHRRLLVAVVAALVVVAPIGYLWASSLLPDTYSVMDMGYPDYGGGPRPGDQDVGDGRDGGHARDVERGPDATGRLRHRRCAERRLVDRRDGSARGRHGHLIARRQSFALAGGRVVDGYTLNGTSPGPEIRAAQGQLVEVRLVNESVPDGITLHWHGIDVPNAMDGVAGVTQDAVPIGGSFVYRFVLDRAGTYWYHSHQVSHEQVLGGLLGALIVAQRRPQGPAQRMG